MSDSKLKPLAKCRVASSLQWREIVTTRVRAWIVFCEESGLSHWDIAVRVGCHRTAVSLWKNGKADMYAGSYVALEQLVNELATQKKVMGA